MPRYIAFLRAINVGGRVVKMDRLRALFEAMGLTGVETFIASGNVIFETPGRSAGGSALERRIETQLADALGYDVAAFLRTPTELAAVAGHTPFGPQGVGDDALYVSFLKTAPGDEATRTLLALATDLDEFHVHGREAWWRCRAKMSESKVTGAMVERALGVRATMRSVTTVRKLTAKYAPAARLRTE